MIRLRSLRPWDALFCWSLARDRVVRQASIDPRRPTLGGHLLFMLRWLTHSAGRAFVVLDGHMRVGLVRFEWTGLGAVMSIALSPSARGQGIGRRAIEAAAVLAKYWYGCEHVIAYVKHGNPRSIRAFSRAGFEFDYNKLGGYGVGTYVD